MEAVIVHEIEPEVAGPAPRRARLPLRTQVLLALAVTLALLLMAGGARALLEAARLGWVAACGRTVAARVTAVQTEPSTTPDQPALLAGFQYERRDPFTGLSLRRFSRVSPVPAADFRGFLPGAGTQAAPAKPPMLHVGDRLPLRIARWRGRSIEYFWGPAPFGKGVFLILCGLVVMCVGVSLIRTLARWRRLRVLLLQHGKAAVGTIIHKQVEVGDVPRYFLRYGYATLPAAEKLEHEEQVSQEQWKRFEIGQPVTVLYDPEQPVRAGLYALIKNG